MKFNAALIRFIVMVLCITFIGASVACAGQSVIGFSNEVLLGAGIGALVAVVANQPNNVVLGVVLGGVVGWMIEKK